MKAKYFVREPVKIYKDWEKLTPFSESGETLRSGNKVVLLRKMDYEDMSLECGSIGKFYKTVGLGIGLGIQFDRLIIPCRRSWVAKYKNKIKNKV
jgi:hypothetical protein